MPGSSGLAETEEPCLGFLLTCARARLAEVKSQALLIEKLRHQLAGHRNPDLVQRSRNFTLLSAQMLERV